MSDYRPPDLALIGRASTGKDTVAHYLAENYGYVVLAFADPLRELAAFVDPIVDPESGMTYTEVLAEFGYREAKDRFPDFRRFLDRLGRGVREVVADDTWTGLLEDRLQAIDDDTPVVVTDVRFPNEVSILCQGYGFDALRLTRKAAPIVDAPSETALDGYRAAMTFANDGPVENLHAFLDALALAPDVLEAAG